MKKNYANKFAVYPTPEQEKIIQTSFRACAFVWNWALTIKKCDMDIKKLLKKLDENDFNFNDHVKENLLWSIPKKLREKYSESTIREIIKLDFFKKDFIEKKYLLLIAELSIKNSSKEFIIKSIRQFLMDNELPLEKHISTMDLSKLLTVLKKKQQWLNQVNAQTLIATLRQLDIAFKRLSSKKGKFPRFKNYVEKRSFSNQQDNRKTPPQNRVIPISNRYGLLSILKVKDLKIHTHRPIKGKIGTVTISQTWTGKYFAALSIEEEIFPKDIIPTKEKTIGIDLNVTHPVVASNGYVVENPRFLKKNLERLAVLQRRLQTKRDRNPRWKNSKHYKRLKIQIAKLNEFITNSRKDLQDKVSHQLVSDEKNELFVLEDLNVKGMVKNKRLAKHISDVGFGEISNKIKYKATWAGKKYIEVSRFYPSSKTCSFCGFYNKNLEQGKKIWQCPNCKRTIDRDPNSTINLKNEGWRVYSSSSNEGA